MNEKVKSLLGVAIIIAILAAAGAAVGYVKYYGKSIEPSSFRSFSVTGEGKAVAIPDIAEFTFSVITEGNKKLPDLQKENTDKSNKIIEFLQQQGIDSKDIKTVNYYVNPRYEHFNCPPPVPFDPDNPGIFSPRPCPPPEINGYTISQTVSVKIRNFDKTGEILSGAVERGANSVSQLTFMIDDRTKVEQEARAEAMRKARGKAEATARAGGFRLGRLLSIDDSYVPIPYYNQYGRFESEGGGGGALPEKVIPPASVEPGSQEIAVNLVLRYEIQ